MLLELYPDSDDGIRTHVTGVKILCDNHLHYNGIFVLLEIYLSHERFLLHFLKSRKVSFGIEPKFLVSETSVLSVYTM